MSRRLGSKNARPSFVGRDRMIKKSEKLFKAIDEFIELSLRNHEAKKQIDYNRLDDVKEEIKYLTKIENY